MSYIIEGCTYVLLLSKRDQYTEEPRSSLAKRELIVQTRSHHLPAHKVDARHEALQFATVAVSVATVMAAVIGGFATLRPDAVCVTTGPSKVDPEQYTCDVCYELSRGRRVMSHRLNGRVLAFKCVLAAM